ncbi:Uncharacterised protein [Mycobacteroides abscessus subsp. abscessus]|nr:Uncharacterised protein [Mycobacteroides abscessus subsp. abscessus]
MGPHPDRDQSRGDLHRLSFVPTGPSPAEVAGRRPRPGPSVRAGAVGVAAGLALLAV